MKQLKKRTTKTAIKKTTQLSNKEISVAKTIPKSLIR